MRLVLFCIILFLAPAGCFLIADRFVSGIEEDFLQDARWQTDRYNRIVEMYPPRAMTIRNAAQIIQLKRLADGHSVATTVCGPLDSPYRRLFDRLNVRCGEWFILRRARYAAITGAMIALATLALVLIARIGVRRYENRKEWVGPWTGWFAQRGIHIVLAVQVAAALAGFAILIPTLLSRPVYGYAALSIGWITLLWVERRTAAGFIEAEKLVAAGPKRHARAIRADA